VSVHDAFHPRESSSAHAVSTQIEFRWLCSLARVFVSQRGRGGLESPKLDNDAPITVETLSALAAEHGLLPLFHWAVQAGIQLLPPNLVATAWAAYQANAARNRDAEARLAEVLTLLAKANILATAHKGPALTHWLYGDAALRVYTDLDFLIAPSDVPAATKLLQTIGYELPSTIPERYMPVFLRAGRQYDLEFVHRETGALVELHWRTDSRYFVENLIREPKRTHSESTVRLHGVDVFQLPKHELMFALLIHGTKHKWSRFAWLVDIALLGQKLSDNDWRWVASAGVLQRCEVRLIIGIELARSLLELKTPQLPWTPALALRGLSLAREIEAALRANVALDSIGRVADFRGDLRFNDRMTQSAAQVVRLLFTPNARDWHDVGDYPGALIVSFPRRVVAMLWRRLRSRKSLL
jgi:hypothetical protein